MGAVCVGAKAPTSETGGGRGKPTPYEEEEKADPSPASRVRDDMAQESRLAERKGTGRNACATKNNSGKGVG